MAEKFYITTPAYYPTSSPHIGTAYSTIAADIVARWHRMRLGNDNVAFVTGLDEHGSKLEKAAAEKGISPQKFVDEMAKVYDDVWKALDISYNISRRTSDKEHVEFVVNEMYARLKKAGDIYKGTYEGWYCLPDESFWTDIQLVDGKCPCCGRAVEKIREEAYFFKLSKYQDKLLKLYQDNPEFISPAFRKQEIINRVKDGLKDLCVSRSKVKWGIPIPGDPKFTIYVWIDALPFYISSLGYGSDKYRKFWPPDVQMMAKEIFWFHAVIWPALLMSANLPLPKKEFAHGWITVNGQKIGKSLGNAIDPIYLAKKYTSDALRYHLFRDISFGNDGDFSEEALKTKVNNELVANYSNLFYRITSFIEKNFDSKVPAKGMISEAEQNLFEKAADAVAKYERHMMNIELSQALAVTVELTSEVNRYIQTAEPWKTIKTDKKAAGVSLYASVNLLRTLSLMYCPFMPNRCKEALASLDSKIEWKNVEKPIVPEGRNVKPIMLFKKFEEEKAISSPAQQQAQQSQPKKEDKLQAVMLTIVPKEEKKEEKRMKPTEEKEEKKEKPEEKKQQEKKASKDDVNDDILLDIQKQIKEEIEEDEAESEESPVLKEIFKYDTEDDAPKKKQTEKNDKKKPETVEKIEEKKSVNKTATKVKIEKKPKKQSQKKKSK